MCRHPISLLIFLLIVQCHKSTAEINFQELSLLSFALPTNHVPLEYDLKLKFTENDQDFYHGEVAISIKKSFDSEHSSRSSLCERLFKSCFVPKTDKDAKKRRKRQIILHADSKIEIFGATFAENDSSLTGTEIQIVGFSRDSAKDLIVFDIGEGFGRGRLRIQFKAPYQKDDAAGGIFRTQFDYRLPEHATIDAGTRPEYVVGSFEPVGARRAFPCFDEPRFRAKLRLEITHNREYQAVSGMLPGEREGVGQDLIKQTFRASKNTLPVHKLSFVIGRLKRLEYNMEGRDLVELPTAVWAHPSLVEQGMFAISNARTLLDNSRVLEGMKFATEMFEIVALPNYSRKIMSGFGLCLVSQDLLILDPEDEPIKKIELFEQMVKLAARQSFGNTASPRTWRDHWLIEVLAGVMESREIKKVSRQVLFDIGYRYRAFSERSDALRFDLHDTKPYRLTMTEFNLNDLTDPSDVRRLVLQREQFSAKAAAIGRLLERIDKKIFDEIIDYLQITTCDSEQAVLDLKTFIGHLNDSPEEMQIIKKDFEEIRSWYVLEGYPLLFVDHDERTNSITIRQQLIGQPSKNFNSVWLLVLKLSFGDANIVREEKHARGMKASIKLPNWFSFDNPQHWIKLELNPDESAYYRVMYSDKLMAALRVAIEREYLEPIDRIHVLDDALALFETERLSAEKFEELLRRFYASRAHKKMHYTEILHLLKTARLYPVDLSKQPYVNALVRFVDFGSGRRVATIELHARSEALKRLVEVNEMSIVNSLLRRFNQAEVRPLKIFEREAAYSAVAKYGNQAQIGELLNILRTSESRSAQMRLVKALSLCLQKPIQAALKEWLDENSFDERRKITGKFAAFEENEIQEIK